MVYSADHLMMLVTAFEVQQIGLPAERAIKTVNMGWAYLKVGYGAAFDLQDQFKPNKEKILAQIFGGALKELQCEPDIPGPASELLILVAVTATAFAQQLSRESGGRLSYGHVLLDLSDIVSSVRGACTNFGGVKETDFGAEFSTWSKYRGGYIRGGHPLHPEEADAVDQEA